tara:strand:- start:168 stop:785 length:618 start_codon:yes stop_codon:yes gene_type:complete
MNDRANPSDTSTMPDLFNPADLRERFDRGLGYADYLETGTDHQQRSWEAVRERATLSEPQRALLNGFVREVNILAISGIWCGDCVQQLPFLEAFRAANPDRVRLRYLDRDAHADFTRGITICSGNRVPVVVFMNEDFDFVSLFGDRTLSRYRAMAARQLGPSCPVPGAAIAQDELDATLQDWLNELERVHLLCRLSTKLRGRYGD